MKVRNTTLANLTYSTYVLIDIPHIKRTTLVWRPQYFPFDIIPGLRKYSTGQALFCGNKSDINSASLHIGCQVFTLLVFYFKYVASLAVWFSFFPLIACPKYSAHDQAYRLLAPALSSFVSALSRLILIPDILRHNCFSLLSEIHIHFSKMSKILKMSVPSL